MIFDPVMISTPRATAASGLIRPIRAATSA